MTDHRRSAPIPWGASPLTKDPVIAVVKRAARTLAQQLEAEGWEGVTILVAEPENASALDPSLVGVEPEIVVGYIRAIGKHRGFTVYWDPATDTGRIYRTPGYDWRA
jgi:hypothetical protein